jgi:hypothetical protein
MPWAAKTAVRRIRQPAYAIWTARWSRSTALPTSFGRAARFDP